MYFKLDPLAVKRPNFAFNYKCHDSPWLYVPTKAVPPCCVPTVLGGIPLLKQVSNDFEDLLRHAVRRGLSVKVDELKAIIRQCGVALPKEGSGKNNRVVKIDFAWCLVNFLFGESETLAVRKVMVSHIAGTYKERPQDEGDCPEKLVKAALSLDASEQDHFKHVKNYALGAMERKLADRSKGPKLPIKEPPPPAPPPPGPPPAGPAPPAGPHLGAPGPHHGPGAIQRHHIAAKLRPLLPALPDHLTVYLKPYARRYQCEVKGGKLTVVAAVTDCCGGCGGCGSCCWIVIAVWPSLCQWLI